MIRGEGGGEGNDQTNRGERDNMVDGIGNYTNVQGKPPKINIGFTLHQGVAMRGDVKGDGMKDDGMEGDDKKVSAPISTLGKDGKGKDIKHWDLTKLSSLPLSSSSKKVVKNVESNHDNCQDTKYRRSSYRFMVGRRHDMQSSIKDALEDLGMCKIRDEKTRYDFVWDKTFDIYGKEEEREKYNSPRIKDGAIVSSIPGVRENLGLKPSLARVHSSCLNRHSHLPDSGEGVCAFTKRAFNFERDKRELKIEGGLRKFTDYVHSLTGKYGEQQWPQLWIFKPQESFLGRGIKMLRIEKEDVSDRKGIAKWAAKKFPNGKWTLQEYVRNPALYSMRKFDIRVWSVLTSINPLRIYTLDHGFAKISTVDYTPAIESMDDLCMHVKMPLGPGCLASNLVRPYPKATSGSVWEDKLEFKGTDKDVGWKDGIWQQVEDQVSINIISGLASVKAREWEMFGGDRDAIKRYKRFVFLSPDFAFDNQGKVWMEEMNTNGFMIGDTYKDFFPAQDSTIQMMQLLGADRFKDKWKYEGAMKEVLDIFCRENEGGCSAEGREELERMINEEKHSHMEWRRTWPPRENEWPGMTKVRKFWDNYKALLMPEESEKGEDWHGNGEPTELDLLMWKFVEFRWFHTLGKGDKEGKGKVILKTCIYCDEAKERSELNKMHNKWWDA
mmetsp:Transcript_7971/g.16041  ORF Transcript_7971/g.16041 Transcript_7971/m.16041 type:complete len:668 (+) Transcript_7971:2-2005(+)